MTINIFTFFRKNKVGTDEQVLYHCKSTLKKITTFFFRLILEKVSSGESDRKKILKAFGENYTR